jgi:hypothetical protein
VRFGIQNIFTCCLCDACTCDSTILHSTAIACKPSFHSFCFDEIGPHGVDVPGDFVWSEMGTPMYWRLVCVTRPGVRFSHPFGTLPPGALLATYVRRALRL